MTSSSTSFANSSDSDRNISEEMLANMYEKLIVPTDGFERLTLLKDEVSVIEKQCIIIQYII
jgi:hypothetical protein